MKIWLVTVGEPLPIDGSGTRLYRSGIMAEILAGRGHQVVWWTSTFHHWRKQHCFPRDTRLQLNNGVELRLVHGWGYQRNISIRRIIDHIIVAKKFACLAEAEPRPDVILCSLPTLELVAAATRYGRRYCVPVVVDVRDLWPDLFIEFAPSWAHSFVKIALGPMRAQARRGCRDAFAITGSSPEFVAWGLRYAGRPAGCFDRHFPFGYMTAPLEEAERERALAFWRNFDLVAGSGNFVVAFFGTMNSQFDLDTVVDAALLLSAEGRPVRFVLCGTGERAEALKARAHGDRAVVFPGWVGKAEIRTLMEMAQAGLAPYRNHVGFMGNLPNKPIEYLAGGLPVVSSLTGYLADFLKREGCGVIYPEGNARALRDTLVRFLDNPDLLKFMANNARRVFADQFEASKVYGGMIDYLQEVSVAFCKRVGTRA